MSGGWEEGADVYSKFDYTLPLQVFMDNVRILLRLLKHRNTVWIDCCNRQGCTTKGRLKFVRWRIFVGPQFGTCLISSFWSPEFGGDSWIFGKSVQFCCWL